MHKHSYLTFALVGTLLAAPLAAFAQNSPAPVPSPGVSTNAPGATHRHGGAMRRALATLALSDTQRTQIRDIMQTYRRSRASGTPETREQLRAQIDGVLTPDERTRFATALRRARAEQRASEHKAEPAQAS